MPNTISTIAMSHRSRNTERMVSWARKPMMTIGMVPMMISQPRRTSGSSLGMFTACAPLLEPKCRNHRPMMRTMSLRKYRITASSVPSCVMAVNVAPGSVADGRNSPAMRRWALEEMGRNSVRPWMSPRMIASMNPTVNSCLSS